jgi:hypothetical protein
VCITTLLEKLLKRDVKHVWNQACQEAFDPLKENLVTMCILVFLGKTKLLMCMLTPHILHFAQCLYNQEKVILTILFLLLVENVEIL